MHAAAVACLLDVAARASEAARAPAPPRSGVERASIEALQELVDPALLQAAVLPLGDHRLESADSAGFVAGYPRVVADFALQHSH